MACDSILLVSKANSDHFGATVTLTLPIKNLIPSTQYLRIGLINYREHPVTPRGLSNHNQYMTAAGPNPRCDLVLPCWSTLSHSLQRIDIKSSPFCHLPVISTEATQRRCLRVISWLKDYNEDNGVTVFACVAILNATWKHQ